MLPTWTSYALTVPVPERAVTQEIRAKLGFGQQALLVLLQWIVGGIPVIVGRAGGTLGESVSDTRTLLSGENLNDIRLTDIGHATALALVELDLPFPPEQTLILVEFETKAAPSPEYMHERLSRIWEKLSPKPWDRILMVGDMSGHLDGVMLQAMNPVTSKSLDQMREEMGEKIR